ncbi:MAG: patatin-like protein [Ilumatobacteraceae bacterium]
MYQGCHALTPTCNWGYQMKKPIRPDELRIALSMRGGVSLAVWIGGSAAEVDELTKSEAAQYDERTSVGPPSFYPALLKMAGYERAVLDVITGASAGGLNGVVLSASRVYGFQFDAMLPIWIRLADIELLTRDPREKHRDPPVTGKYSHRPQSLLRGDEYFLVQLTNELRKLVVGGDEQSGVSEPFELILSATLENPEYETTDADPFAPLQEIRRSASFVFRYLGETGDNGGDFQHSSDAVAAKKDSTVSLLALAGRATSSFPVAFEPASVGVDAARVFSDAPQRGEPDRRVLDGGVLDNIPVSKAIDAIAAAPVAGEAERWLVFLHPSPSAKVASPSKLRASPRAFSALVTTASAAFGQESLLDDLAELERHNAEVRRQRLRREALLRTITPEDPHPDVPTTQSGLDEARNADAVTAVGQVKESADRLKEHTPIVRAKLDANRALRVVSGRLRVRRPLTDGPDRAKWSEWLNAARRQLEDEIATAGYRANGCLSDELGERPERTAAQSAGGLLLACNLVGAWLRQLDPGPDQATANLLETLAQMVSELRRIVQLALNWSDQAWLVAASDGPKVDMPWAHTTALLAAESMRRVPSDELQAVKEAFGMPADGPAHLSFVGTPSDLRSRVGKPVGQLDEVMRAQIMAGVSVANDHGDLGKWIWDGLVSIIAEVAAHPEIASASSESREFNPGTTPTVPGIQGPPSTSIGGSQPDKDDDCDCCHSDKQETIERWRQDRAHDLLSRVRTSQEADSMLESLVAVLTPAQASMLESDEELRFVRISGSNETPLKRYFAPDGSPFGVDEKLCGNELGNFAAFCSARWRANDWMWGRLDAVKSLVDLTMRPERVGRSAMDADDIWRTVQRITAAAGMTLTQHQIDTLKMEIEVAKLGQPNPDGTKLVRELLTEARQRQIYGSMRGLIDKLGEGPYFPEEISKRSELVGPELQVQSLDDSMARYNVGSETIRDLDSRRRTQIGMRLALVSHRAFRPIRKWTWMNWVTNRLMTLTKPLYLFAVYGSLNLARALFVVNMIAVGLWVGPWRFEGAKSSVRHIWQFLIYDHVPDVLHPSYDRNPFHGKGSIVGFALIAALSVFSMLLAISNKRLRSRRLKQRLKPPAGLWWYISSFVVGLVGLLGNWAYGINLGPVSAAIGGALLATLACLWMRKWMVFCVVPIGVFALHAAAATAWWLFKRHTWLGYTRWISLAALFASLAFITILSSYAPVLDDEKRVIRRAEKRGGKRLRSG